MPQRETAHARPQPEVTRPEVTRPKPEVTRPKPEVTRPKPEVTIPKPEVTRPKPEMTANQRFYKTQYSDNTDVFEGLVASLVTIE